MAPVQAKEIMTTAVISARPDAALAAVADLLVRHRISGVPVLDEGEALVGLVSEHDLLAKEGRTAADVMTTALVTVTEDADVDDVRHLLVERRIGRVPVVSGGRVVGIISRGDVVATMATEWVCRVCGEPVRGAGAPTGCPRCHSAQDRFVLQEQPPGT
jgi:CBS domain-containing protein